jgi:hypothetical protein
MPWCDRRREAIRAGARLLHGIILQSGTKFPVNLRCVESELRPACPPLLKKRNSVYGQRAPSTRTGILRKRGKIRMSQIESHLCRSEDKHRALWRASLISR